MAELQRASVLAIKEETTVGTLVEPSAGSDFIPLRPGNTLDAEFEDLTSDELINDIGPTKGQLGKESATGSHPIYLKNSDVEGTPPEWSLLMESSIGALTTAAGEQVTIGGSTAGDSSTRATIKVGGGIGATFEEGEGLLIKDGVNGYRVRNVNNISTDDLLCNFNLDNAPASGVSLGISSIIKPLASGHPSYSVWKYIANGAGILAAAGCRTSNVSVTIPAAAQTEATFDFEGTEVFFNPITITAATSYIDFTDDSGTYAAQLTQKTYKTPDALAAEVASQMNSVASDTITCVWNSTGSDAGKFVISSDGGATFSLLWNTGANTANTAAAKLGYSSAADDTGAFTYTSDSEQDWSAGFTASYDGATNVVGKKIDFHIGDFDENICRPASEITFTIATPLTDVDDACTDTGLAEKLLLSREVTLNATLILQKHETGLFDKYLNNSDVEVMVNVGRKDSADNWIPGTIVNFYMQKATITENQPGQGDEIVTANISARGFVDSSNKDIFINFL